MKNFASFSLMLVSFSQKLYASSAPGLWEQMQAPEDISTDGHLIDYIFNYTTALNVFFFALVCFGIFGFSYLYSKKRHPKPYYTHGNTKMQKAVAFIVGLAVFLGIDMNITRMSNRDYINVFAKWPDEKKEDVVKVQVLAQQWVWNFRYPGADDVFNTDDDVVTTNDLRLPTGKKVVLQFLSKDVIHSFFLPNTRRKIDVIPGRVTRMWFELTKSGVYGIACAEMCGTSHYLMAAKLTVYSPADYDAWLKEAEAKALDENDTENLELYWGWNWNP